VRKWIALAIVVALLCLCIPSITYGDTTDDKLTEMNNKISDVYLRLGALDSKVALLSMRIDSIDSKLAGFDSSITGIIIRLSLVDNRISSIDKRTNSIEYKVSSADSNITSLVGTISDLTTIMGDINNKVDIYSNTASNFTSTMQIRLFLIVLGASIIGAGIISLICRLVDNSHE
jgi:peptidoglycan hydrolase CwlO-like protein